MKPHIPIMVENVIKYLKINRKGTYIDCTIGYGGHASYILKAISNHGRLIGIDRDKEAIEYCKKSLFIPNGIYNKKKISLFRNSYHRLPSVLKKSNTQKVDGVLLDLGLSSMQLDSLSRGFSYRFDSALDMRFNNNQKLKASDILNSYSIENLANMFLPIKESIQFISYDTKRAITPYLYMAPTITLLTSLMLLPMIVVFRYSLFDNVIMNKNPTFVGLENYQKLFYYKFHHLKLRDLDIVLII